MTHHDRGDDAPMQPHDPDEAAQNDVSEKPQFPVVGLGASAGGLRALQQFFQGMPVDSGMAFVVIMHLSPDHESRVASILQNATTMPVTQVNETVTLEPDRVYVIPPTKHLSMLDGVIQVVEAERPLGRHVAIDVFFRTLAETHHTHAVGIVLSGTGADGSVGIKRLKETGGVAIAQEPGDAEYDGMPRNAINTGVIDWVLPVAEMPERLIALWRNAKQIALPTDVEAPILDPNHALEQALHDVLATVRVRTGHDFTHYKRGTLLRRIERRMQVLTIQTLPVYRDYLREHPQEATLLLQDLLIGVTNFFRDRQAFDALEREVVPLLFEGKTTGDVIRVWVAGCASGEEAYSVVMLLLEYAAGLSHPPDIQIFATDIDELAIQLAREGSYPASIEADVSIARLRQFFTREAGGYRINKQVRERVLFAAHNLIKDPPFSRCDLVTCRNLLIYLNRTAQEQVFGLFHFALHRDGFLFLGSSESVDGASDLFTPLDTKHRLFRAKPTGRALRDVPVLPLEAPLGRPVPAQRNEERRRIAFGELHQRMLEHYAPPSIVVNDANEIVHLSDHAGRFIQFGGGEPSLDLLAVVLPPLRAELRTALFQAFQSGKAVEARRVQIERDGHTSYVNMIVRPQHDQATDADYALVVFAEADQIIGTEGTAAEGDAAEPMVRHLEAEIQQLRAQLQTSSERYETSLEELKASNEELQAINEEFRSTTEELETSKEELQSVNEELRTVNQALNATVDEVSAANDDLSNLVSSTDIATVFLDRALRVKRYTPRAQDIFNLLPLDEGRLLSDITNMVDYADMLRDASTVLRTLQPVEREIRSHGDRWFLARMLPYRTLNDYIEGVVLTFVDITARKHAEDAVRASEARQTFLLNLSDVLRPLGDPIAIEGEACRLLGEWVAADRAYYVEVDEEAGVARVARDWVRSGEPSLVGEHRIADFGWSVAILRRGEYYIIADTQTSDLVPPADRPAVAALQIIACIGVPLIKDGGLVGALCVTASRPRTWTESEVELLREVGERIWAAVQRARAQTALSESERRLQLALDASDMGTFLYHIANDCGEPDARMLALFGLPPDGTLNLADALDKLIHPNDRARYADDVARATDPAGAGVLRSDIRVVYGNDSLHWIAITGQVVFEGEPRRATHMYGVAANITERKQAEEALRQSEERQRFLIESAIDYAIFTTDPDRSVSSWNTGAERIFGYAEGEIVGHSADILFVPEDRERGAPQREAETARDHGRAGNERWHLRKDGTRFYGSGVVTPLRDDAGALHGFVKIMRDLTAQKQAEEALRASEERYHTLFKAMDEGYCIINLRFDAGGRAQDYRFLEVNPAFEQQTGLVDVVGRWIHDLVPAHEQYWFDIYGKVAMTGEPTRFIQRAGALGRWFDVYAFRIGEPSAHNVAVLFIDITEHKRREADLAFLAEVSQDLTRLTSIEETMNALSAKIGAHFDLSLCRFIDIDEAADIGVVNYGWHRADVPKVSGAYRIGDFMNPEFVRMSRDGETIVVRDASADPLTNAEQFAALKIGAFVTVPIVRGGAWRFCLGAYRSEAHDWHDDEIELIRELTTRIYTQLERARAEEALRASEERLQKALSIETIGVLFFGLDKRITDTNEAFARMTGYSRDELVTKVDMDVLTHPDFRDRTTRAVEELAAQGEAPPYEKLMVRKDGSHWWGLFAAERLNGTGSAADCVEFVVDITERKQAETALRASEERARTLVKNLPGAAAFIFDRDLRYVLADGEALYAAGKTPADYEGQLVDDVLAPDSLVSMSLPLRRALGGEAFEDENMEGGMAFLSRGVPLRDENGEVTGVLVVSYNITERKQAEAALERAYVAEQLARNEAESALHTRDQFLSIASHELRTPLTSLLGYTNMLSMPSAHDPTTINRMTERISRQALRLNALIEQLLDVSRLQRGQFAIQPEPVDIAAVVAHVVDETRPTLPPNTAHRIEFTIPRKPVIIAGDAQRLEQVMQNVLSNAVKYSPEGGLIRIDVRRSATEAVIEVVDQGIGIAAEAQARLFEPFYRAPNVGQQMSGFGLGLYIVREIVERHGGRIEVESEEGVGSTFRVVLPLQGASERSS